MNVPGAQTVLRAVLDKPLLASIMKIPLRAWAFCFPKRQYRPGCPCHKRDWPASNNAFNISLTNQVSADLTLRVTPEEHAMGHNAGPHPRALERADDMQQVSIITLTVGWHAEGFKPA